MYTVRRLCLREDNEDNRGILEGYFGEKFYDLGQSTDNNIDNMKCTEPLILKTVLSNFFTGFQKKWKTNYDYIGVN